MFYQRPAPPEIASSCRIRAGIRILSVPLPTSPKFINNSQKYNHLYVQIDSYGPHLTHGPCHLNKHIHVLHW